MNNGVRGYDPSTDLKTYFVENGIKVVKVGAPDMEGIWRGKRIMAEFFLKTVATEGSHFSDLLFGWDVQGEPILGLKHTGPHTGFPDMALVPDLSTLHVVPGEPGVAAVICDAFSLDGEPVELAPREILRRMVKRAEEAGYRPLCAYEFEFYLFEGSPRELARNGYRDLVPINEGIYAYSICRDSGTDWLIGEIRDRLAEIGVFIEASNSEYGPGQFEVNIHYGDALAAADSALLLKNTVKEVAAEHGYTASFMAKIKTETAGNSGHVHMSMHSLDGGEALFANPADKHSLSELGMNFMAGVLDHAHELTALYLPTPNAFKRVEGGQFAGSNTSWGVDNRTVAVRSIPSAGPAARVENRIAGADANPYLVLAATIASGLEGIQQKSDPGAAIIGNAYELDCDESRRLPNTLDKAVELFAGSAMAKKYFGEDFVEHYAQMRRWEAHQARIAVTQWDVERYLERM